jgi:hypothetical protein
VQVQVKLTCWGWSVALLPEYADLDPNIPNLELAQCLKPNCSLLLDSAGPAVPL